MKKNIGTTDKIVRLIFALFLVILNLTDVITGVSGLYVVIASVVVVTLFTLVIALYILC